MQKNLTLPINIWLIALALIVLSMIAVGGLTRLTESGLSMVDWQLIMGVIPPLNQTDWLQLFEDYKLYPEYRIKNLNMSLDEFKYIFWWEYGHRVLGRLIGIIFLIPFIYFSFKKSFTKSEYKFYFILLFLGGFQGLIGWWMVKSGLDMNPYVSHIRLAVHLILAQIILSLIFFQLLKRTIKNSYKKIQNNTQKLHLMIIGFLVFIQLIIGVMVILTNVAISLGSLHQIIGTIIFILSSSYSLSILRY